MTRLLILLCLLGLPAVSACAAQPGGFDPTAAHADLEQRFVRDWRRFKHRYVTDDGRVVDTGNGDVSHSEGQGYGMLFAVAADDRETFDQLHAWTRQHLERDDGLHYWRFDPRSEPMIQDPNSAADGELLIAWALLRAARRWQERTFLVQARVIAQAFESRLVRRIGSRLVIMPWDLADLESPRVINPSYFVFPAMQDLAVEIRSTLWVELYEDCLALIADARFGVWRLPPDWLAIDDENRLGIWSERNPYFSYDAIRIPLHLIWAGHDSEEFLEPFLRTWMRFPEHRTPEWFDVSPAGGYSASVGPPGFRAVRRLTEAASAPGRDGRSGRTPMPTIYDAPDYYSASLILLSRLAELDSSRSRLTHTADNPELQGNTNESVRLPHGL